MTTELLSAVTAAASTSIRLLLWRELSLPDLPDFTILQQYFMILRSGRRMQMSRRIGAHAWALPGIILSFISRVITSMAPARNLQPALSYNTAVEQTRQQTQRPPPPPNSPYVATIACIRARFKTAQQFVVLEQYTSSWTETCVHGLFRNSCRGASRGSALPTRHSLRGSAWPSAEERGQGGCPWNAPQFVLRQQQRMVAGIPTCYFTCYFKCAARAI